VGHGDRDSLAVGLVGEIIFHRPPDAGAQSFVRGRDPRAAEAVRRPDETAVPRGTFRDPRLAMVIDRDGVLRAGSLPKLQRDEQRIPIAMGREVLTVLN